MPHDEIRPSRKRRAVDPEEKLTFGCGRRGENQKDSVSYKPTEDSDSGGRLIWYWYEQTVF